MNTNQQQLLVQCALNSWEIQVSRATKAFHQLSDEDLFLEIAPDRNRAVYLLGHLVAVHDAMIPLLGFGERQYEFLDDTFLNNPDREGEKLPPVKDLRAYWKNINSIITEQFRKLKPEEWLEKHTAISDEDFAREPHRNRLSVLLNRTNHISYHIGQLALLKK